MTSRLAKEAPGYRLGHPGPFKRFRGYYWRIDSFTRGLRRLWFEPCRTAERGRPWEDCQ